MHFSLGIENCTGIERVPEESVLQELDDPNEQRLHTTTAILLMLGKTTPL